MKNPAGFLKISENRPIRGPNTPFEAEFPQLFEIHIYIEKPITFPIEIA